MYIRGESYIHTSTHPLHPTSRVVSLYTIKRRQMNRMPAIRWVTVVALQKQQVLGGI